MGCGINEKSANGDSTVSINEAQIEEIKNYESRETGTEIQALERETIRDLPDIRMELDKTTESSFSFEKEGLWVSVPPELTRRVKELEIPESELAGYRPNKFRSNEPVLPQLDLAAREKGLVLSEENRIEGDYSGMWKDHQLFPSILCEHVPGDWSEFNGLTVNIYSEVATGQHVTIGVISDSPETPWKDWYFYGFKVDWTGNKRLRIPFGDFQSFEQPKGWDHVSAIGFFAKAFGYQPIPETALYLDDLAIIRNENLKPEVMKTPEVEYKSGYYEKMNPLNHPFPEIMTPAPVSQEGEPIVHGRYFGFERAVYGYNPRFQPGYVSFDMNGKAYIKAGNNIQWLGDDGEWTYTSLKTVLEDWALEKGFKRILNYNTPNSSEPKVRFDIAGEAYILERIGVLNEAGLVVRSISLLLHSKDHFQTWSIHDLNGMKNVAFEKMDCNNISAINYPPVMIGVGRDKVLQLILPSKKEDGSLDISNVVPVAKHGLGNSTHSGDANTVITVNEMLYIAYGWCPSPSDYPKIKKELESKGQETGGSWTWRNLVDTELGKELSFIPENHPAKEMKFQHFKAGPRKADSFAVDGVPSFVKSYNRNTGELSDPVFVGFGGYTMDGHNWPAIAVDIYGYITVLINGHHDPLTYTRTVRPLDISEWTDPTYIDGDNSRISYATLIADKHGNLYSVNRSTSYAYNNALVLLRKKVVSEGWEKERYLIWPWRAMYNAWSHKMSYDPVSDRLYLTYFPNGSGQQLGVDSYEYFIFTYPDQEARVAKNSAKGGDNSGSREKWARPLNKKTGFYTPEMNECAILVSEDQGETWHLATSKDFQ